MDATTTTSTAIMPSLVALCYEIRSTNIMGNKRDGAYHWAIGRSFGFQMQSITCAICGNYQLVNLQEYISRAVLCTNIVHIDYTANVIEEENRQNSNNDEDTDEDLVTSVELYIQ